MCGELFADPRTFVCHVRCGLRGRAPCPGPVEVFGNHQPLHNPAQSRVEMPLPQRVIMPRWRVAICHHAEHPPQACPAHAFRSACRARVICRANRAGQNRSKRFRLRVELKVWPLCAKLASSANSSGHESFDPSATLHATAAQVPSPLCPPSRSNEHHSSVASEYFTHERAPPRRLGKPAAMGRQDEIIRPQNIRRPLARALHRVPPLRLELRATNPARHAVHAICCSPLTQPLNDLAC